MKTQKTILITGTHHTPAIELIQELRQDKTIDWNIYYLAHMFATDSHISHTLIPKLKVKFENIECGKFNRKDLIATLTGIPKIFTAFFKSLKIINSVKPDITVSFGGYVSVPVIAASYFKKIPSITHEQTLTNSFSTRLNSRFVDKIALSFDNKRQINQLPENKVVVTGNLIRSNIFDSTSSHFAKQKFDLQRKPLIYITGGNQGSLFINNLTYSLISTLASKYTIVHQTGKNNDPSLEKNLRKTYSSYYSSEYIDMEDIGWVLNHAFIVISRAGANICQELSILNKNTILIPLPFTQQNEQLLNAKWLKSKIPTRVLIFEQSKATTISILKAIQNLSKNRSTTHVSKSLTPHPLLKLVYEMAN